MIVRLTATAARQLAGILAYLDEQTDRPGQRRMVLGPYPHAVVDRVRGDEVLIQRIRHTARRAD